MNSLLSPHCGSTSSTELTIASIGRHAVAISIRLLLIGCAGLRIEYLIDETYQPRLATSQIEWLEQEPAQPHIELARITVSSANLNQESLRRHLMDRARSLGADAVVTEPPMTMISKAGSPYYEPDLFSPAGAADQPKVDYDLSAIAIRYQQVSETAPSR